MADFALFIIVHPTIASRREQIQETVEKAGFKEFHFVVGTKSVDSTDAAKNYAICNAHYECFSRFISMRCTKDLLILEDDAEFICKDPFRSKTRCVFNA